SFPRDFGQCKLIWLDRLFFQRAGIACPSFSAVDRKVGPNDVQTSSCYEAEEAAVRIPLLAEQLGLAFAAAHLAQEAPQRQVMSDRQRHRKVNQPVSGVATGTDPDLMDVLAGEF